MLKRLLFAPLWVPLWVVGWTLVSLVALVLLPVCYVCELWYVRPKPRPSRDALRAMEALLEDEEGT